MRNITLPLTYSGWRPSGPRLGNFRVFMLCRVDWPARRVRYRRTDRGSEQVVQVWTEPTGLRDTRDESGFRLANVVVPSMECEP